MPLHQRFPWLFQPKTKFQGNSHVPDITIQVSELPPAPNGIKREVNEDGSRNEIQKGIQGNFWSDIAWELHFIDESARTSVASEAGVGSAYSRRLSSRSVSTGEPRTPHFLSTDHSINSKVSSQQTLALNENLETPVFDEEKPPQYNSYPHLFASSLSQTQTSSETNGKTTSADLDGKGRVRVRLQEKEMDEEMSHALNRPSHYPHNVDKDFRYYFQHPYPRLFITYFVIFCNFLIFAEDPVSHSHVESEIPVVGNVFSFVLTKYPPEWYWILTKVLLWLVAMLLGMVIGKQVIHKLILGRLCRLKMFYDEQGSWMVMFLTVILSLYIFSHLYNTLLMFGHPKSCSYQITALMGISNSSFMKAAACGTWLGDFITAWMVTDMILQDNMYPGWAPKIRAFWRKGNTRIVTFWAGSIGISALVITLIVSDLINWDLLNQDFVATTELSRAFLASFILIMDLLIVMQDWDFPHFTSTLDINLPGMKIKALQLNFCRCISLKPYWRIHITGKWFNYGIILMVMILDLNMWKNQIFYTPEDYGQYIGPDYKVYTVSEQEVLLTGNKSLWSYEWRSSIIDPATNLSLRENDMKMNSRYLGYTVEEKCSAFIPSIIGFIMFILLIILYGRFPQKSIKSISDRLRKGKRIYRSSWKRDRESIRTPKSSIDDTSRISSPLNVEIENLKEIVTVSLKDISETHV